VNRKCDRKYWSVWGWHLKEKPMMKLKNHGIDAVLTGIRAMEAHIRMLRIGWSGQFYYAKKYGCWKYHPIVFWTTSQLNSYIADHQIPLSDLYIKKGVARSGCWPCTAFKGWQEQLAHVNPRLYKFLIEKIGEQGALNHFYKTRVQIPCGGRAEDAGS